MPRKCEERIACDSQMLLLLLFVHSIPFEWFMLAKPIAWTQHEQQNKTLYRSRDCKMNKLTLASKLHAFLRMVKKARSNRKYCCCCCCCCQDASFFRYFSKIKFEKSIQFETKIQLNSYVLLIVQVNKTNIYYRIPIKFNMIWIIITILDCYFSIQE